jgi:uncharacterized protein (TIRG00374 family)
MRKLLILIVLFLAITLIIFSFSELQDVIQTLQHANIGFVALAVLAEVAWFFVLGWMFQSLYALLGLKESIERLTLLASAGSFVGVVTPSAGVGGLAIFIADGQGRGHPSGKVTVAGALYALLDQAAFLCVLALGIVVLIRRNHLGAAEITASLILLAVAIFLAFLLYLGYRSTEALGNVLARLARIVNAVVRPFIHRQYLSEARAHEFAADISSGLAAVPSRPRSLIQAFLLSLGNKLLLMTVLVFSFLSFDVPFSAGTIVGGFAIAYLFLIVSPTPSGVGVVEGVLAVALHSLGVEFSAAVIVTLAYRGVTVWLPLAVGALAFRALHLNAERSSQAKP